MKKLLVCTVLASILACMVSCDEDTLGVGTSMMPGEDGIITKTKSYVVRSYTEEADSVLANTNTCMIGRIIDPETRSMTTCDFLAQFHVLENYAFPREEVMLKDENGIVADSCDLRIYFDSYYGDSLTPMVLKVYELDTLKVMEENRDYFTNINPNDYINANSVIKDSLVYTVCDMARDTLDETNANAYYKSIKVSLPKSYGKYLINKYYEDKNNYKNSYNFIHNVCPGFYFESAGGLGSMVNVKVSALNVYFRYHAKTKLGNDTIVDGMQRMAATEEVIQNTRISNDLPIEMKKDTLFTYVKSPAALYTVLELPIEEIYANMNDDYSTGNDPYTLSSAMLSLRRFNAQTESDYVLPAPKTLLMVRKNEMKDFFREEKVANGKESFVADYSSSANAYVFTNVSSLIRACYEDKLKGKADWNKVAIVPVTTEYATSTNSYGVATKTLLKVRNDFSLSSVRLEGGTSEKLEISVVYSRFGTGE